MTPRRPWLIAALFALALAAPALAAGGTGTIGGAEAESSLDHLWRVLSMRDHNTRVVVFGTMMLGVAAGVVGTYMLLRKRALVGNALSHATLPGIAIAFMVMVAFGGAGKNLPGLLLGAAVFGLIGVGAILLIKNMTRIKEDAALGIVLSVSFGFGIVLLGIIQKMPVGGQAGLSSFIEGNAAAMLRGEALFIGIMAVFIVLACAVLYKEFALLSFDSDFARVQGWPTIWLDLLMMTLVTAVTVIGLQAVGLILIIALLIIPPAAARFWTNHLRWTLTVAGAIGAGSALAGTVASALFQKLPAGAIIVVFAAGAFALSALFGTQRGMLVRALRHVRLRRSIARQHLLRAAFEWIESHDADDDSPIPTADLYSVRSWSAPALRRVLRRVRRTGLMEPAGHAAWRLTTNGRREAERLAVNHRLWEMYLITHADIAPSHVDRDADQIEHVLGPDMVRRLHELLQRAAPDAVPPSPHRLAFAASKDAEDQR